MERIDKYYTQGEYVSFCIKALDISIEVADIIRSSAIQIAADKGVRIKFAYRYKSGPRRGYAAIKLPRWVWDEAFEKSNYGTKYNYTVSE